jgi:hypothetical protein
MFRFAIYSLIALRVLFCPLFCFSAPGVSHATVAGTQCPEVRSCSCGAEYEGALLGEVPSERSNDESPSEDPCQRGCVCQSLVEKPSKPDSIKPEIWEPLAFSTVELEALLAPHFGVEVRKSPLRPDLLSGMAIRLAFASLLL